MNATPQPVRLRRRNTGFTLLELLTALTVSVLLILMLVTVFNQSSKAWVDAETQVEEYTVARNLLNQIEKELSQLCVSPRIHSTDNYTVDTPFWVNGSMFGFYTTAYATPSNNTDLSYVRYEGANGNLYRFQTTYPNQVITNNYAPWWYTTTNMTMGGYTTNYWSDLSQVGQGVLPNVHLTSFSVTPWYLVTAGVAGSGTLTPTTTWSCPANNWSAPAVVVIKLGILDSRHASGSAMDTNANTRYFSKRIYLPCAAP